jgi:hypothetical protein
VDTWLRVSCSDWWQLLNKKDIQPWDHLTTEEALKGAGKHRKQLNIAIEHYQSMQGTG